MHTGRGDRHSHAPSRDARDSGARRVQGELIWERKEELGRGAFGVVYKVPWRDASRRETCRAVKCILRSSRNRSADNEWRSLESLGHHKNIINYYGHKDLDFSGTQYLTIELEFIDGSDLTTYMYSYFFSRNKSMPSGTARDFTYQILEGLYFMHSRRYMHCDIKPDNIMLTRDGTVKIADFGLAASVGSLGWKTGGCGTLKYLGPEVFTDGSQGPPTDMWAVGVSLFQMLFKGNFPFRVVDKNVIDQQAKRLLGRDTNAIKLQEAKRRLILEHYSKVLWPVNVDPWAGTHREAYNFVARLLAVDHSRRLTARTALSDPWLRSGTGGTRAGNDAPIMFLPRGGPTSNKENTGIHGLEAGKKPSGKEPALSQVPRLI